MSAWLHLTDFLQLQKLQPGQVLILKSEDFTDPDIAESLLQKANPEDPRFSNSDYSTEGVRVIILTKALSIGVDGFQFIRHLILYSPCSGPYRQLCGRFVRPASR